MTQSNDHQNVAADVRQTGTSFYWPMLLQKQSYREGLFAIYMYCRVLDDIADGAGTKDEKHAALDTWRRRVGAIYSGQPIAEAEQTSLINALCDVIERFTLPQSSFLSLIEGMEADVAGAIVAPTLDSLLVYCGQVAGSVGDLCLSVWGWRGADADQFAKTTGEALQLTNILRDIQDDCQTGRLYLPTEALERADISTLTPVEVFEHPNLPAACHYVSEIAEERFTEARSLWQHSQVPSARPAWVMLSLYEALFKEVLHTGFGAGRPRARLSQMEKVTRLVQAYVTA